MKTDTFEYTVAEYWLPAIIDGDYSGLTDNEIQDIDAWLEANQERSTHWDTDGYIHFSRDEVSGLMADCVQLVQHVIYRG